MKVLSWDIGIKNLAYCIVDSDTKEIFHWEVIENTPSRDSLKLHNEIINNLESRPHLLKVDVLLLEKQPSFNPTMRMVSSSLYTYFYIRGVLQYTPERPKIKELIFFSPRKKLDCTGEWISLPRGGRRGGKKAQNRYAAIKKAGIELAYKKLGETHGINGKWVGFLDSKKKKDDLADCWIQCLSWLEPITSTTKTKSVKTQKVINWGKVVSKKPLKKVEDKPEEWLEGNVKWWMLQNLPKKYEIVPKKKLGPRTGLLTYYNNNQPLSENEVYNWLKEQKELITIPDNITTFEDVLIHYGLKKFYDKNYLELK
jgi:hypothetical protein